MVKRYTRFLKGTDTTQEKNYEEEKKTNVFTRVMMGSCFRVCCNWSSFQWIVFYRLLFFNMLFQYGNFKLFGDTEVSRWFGYVWLQQASFHLRCDFVFELPYDVLVIGGRFTFLCIVEGWRDLNKTHIQIDLIYKITTFISKLELLKYKLTCHRMPFKLQPQCQNSLRP